jgi:hypothetical protein
VRRETYFETIDLIESCLKRNGFRNMTCIPSKFGYSKSPFLVQGLGLCIVNNEALRLNCVMFVVWFLIVCLYRASIVHAVHIDL